MWQIDFVTVFLNSDIQHTVYMEHPEGFVAPGDEEKVCLLKKSIYGTMQGAHDWYTTLGGTFKDLGYRESRADPCVHSRIDPVTGEYTLTMAYTDDMVGGSTSEEGTSTAKGEFHGIYPLTEVDYLNHVLGMQIKRLTNGDITLTQRTYIEQVLKDYGLFFSIPVFTPLPHGIELSDEQPPSSDEDRYFMRDKPYRPLLGSMMWIAGCTRPDIAFAVNLLTQFQNNPGIAHWKALVHLARYLRGTMDYRLVYRAPREGEKIEDLLRPYIYADADYGGCKDTRRSTSGYVGLVGGCPVSWSSKRQPTISSSTAEAEYKALGRAAQQGVWMKSFLDEISLPT